MQRGDPAAKITPRLSAALADRGEGAAHVDVVVELEPMPVPTSGSRQERMETMRRTFEGGLQAVTRQIEAAGGDVLGGAWINRTVRGRIPADQVGRLAEDDAGVRIDLPSSLEAESPSTSASASASTSQPADEEHGAS